MRETLSKTSKKVDLPSNVSVVTLKMKSQPVLVHCWDEFWTYLSIFLNICRICGCEVVSVHHEAARWCLCVMASSGDTAVVPFTDQHFYLCSISRLPARINIPSAWASEVSAFVFTVRSQANTWTLGQRELGWTIVPDCLNYFQRAIICVLCKWKFHDIERWVQPKKKKTQFWHFDFIFK